MLREIGKGYGTLNYPDKFGIYDTYDELLNEDNDPIHKDRAYKYNLELMLVVNLESKKILGEMVKNGDIEYDHRLTQFLYYVLVKDGKHYKISKRYVKKISDFSQCKWKYLTIFPIWTALVLLY